MKILLLSAYDAISHQQWRVTLQAMFGSWQWQVLALPARHFSWRIRGNSLSWSMTESELLSADYDLLLSTSMVDLATLRGLVPELCKLPTLLYFHENQFAYPDNQSRHGMLEAQMVSLYSALAADRLAFNSHYNMQSFLQGIDKLLRRLPDCVPAGVAKKLSVCSQVLPVPVDAVDSSLESYAGIGGEYNGLVVVWNHRWEYDKGPDRLLAAIAKLTKCTGRYKFHVIGQQFRQSPGEFEKIRTLLNASENLELGAWGYVEQERYELLLQRSDIVLSTALHDFQGLSVLEAVAMGCVPLVPDRLAYTEFLPEQYRYRSSIDSPDTEAAGLVERLEELAKEKSFGRKQPLPALGHLGLRALKSEYLDCIGKTIAARGLSGSASPA